MVTSQGFNALLKLVEEPPPHVKFVFATTEPEKVIGTIRSRTHHYPFRLVPPRLLSAYLAELCERGGRRGRAGGAAAGGAGRRRLGPRLAVGARPADRRRRPGRRHLRAGHRPARLHRRTRCSTRSSTPSPPATARAVFAVRRQGDRGRAGPAPVRRGPAAPAPRPGDRRRGAGRAGHRPDRRPRRTRPSGWPRRRPASAAAELTRAADLVADGLTEMRGRDRAPAAARADLRPGAAARRRRRHRGRCWPGWTGSRSGWPSRAAPSAAAPEPRAAARRQPSRSGRRHRRPRRPSPPRGPRRRPGRAAAADPARPPAGAATPAAGAGAQPAAAPAPSPAAPAPAPDARRRAATGLGLVERPPAVAGRAGGGQAKRRFTWILLSQNAQVVAVDDKTLTLGLINAGARNSFGSGGSEEILRQAAIDVIGHDWRVEAIVDPSRSRAPSRPPAPPGPRSGPQPERRSAAAAPEPAPADPPACQGGPGRGGHRARRDPGHPARRAGPGARRRRLRRGRRPRRPGR